MKEFNLIQIISKDLLENPIIGDNYICWVERIIIMNYDTHKETVYYINTNWFNLLTKNHKISEVDFATTVSALIQNELVSQFWLDYPIEKHSDILDLNNCKISFEFI